MNSQSSTLATFILPIAKALRLAGGDPMELLEQAEIDPIFYDAAYYLAPDPGAKKAYALLVYAMEQADRVGIAKFVMRTKQYLAAMRAVDGHLMLSTMVYAD